MRLVYNNHNCTTIYRFSKRQSEINRASLRRHNPSKAGETPDNTRWNSHNGRSCDHHQYHPQRSYKEKVHKGTLGSQWGCRGSGGTSVSVSTATVKASAGSSREVCAETLAYFPNAHAQGSIFVLYMIYIYMPNTFYAKKSLHISLWRHMYMLC